MPGTHFAFPGARAARSLSQTESFGVPPVWAAVETIRLPALAPACPIPTARSTTGSRAGVSGEGGRKEPPPAQMGVTPNLSLHVRGQPAPQEMRNEFQSIKKCTAGVRSHVFDVLNIRIWFQSIFQKYGIGLLFRTER